MSVRDGCENGEECDDYDDCPKKLDIVLKRQFRE